MEIDIGGMEENFVIIGAIWVSFISIQEKLQPFNRLLTHLFNVFENSQKVTDAISRLAYLCYLLNIFSRMKLLPCLGRDQNHKGACPGNMVDVQESPTATMPGLWYWQPHGHMHCHAMWLVEACENVATFVTIYADDDAPGTYGSTVHWQFGPVHDSMTPWTSYATISITLMLLGSSNSFRAIMNIDNHHVIVQYGRISTLEMGGRCILWLHFDSG
jgi:hypothetical protein